MKSYMKRSVLLTLVLAPLVVSLGIANAQQPRPAGVFAIADLDKQFADAGYLLEAVGFPELGLFLLGKDEFTRGLDTSKPIGGYVTVEKMFAANRPRTVYRITDAGRKALERYRQQVGTVLAQVEPIESDATHP